MTDTDSPAPDDGRYAPPKAVVADIPPADAQPAYFPCGSLKFAALSVLTLNLYLFYWFYKNWKLVNARGEQVWAPVRAFFYSLVSFSLFRRIETDCISHDVHLPPSPAGMGFAVFVLSALSRLPDPYWVGSFLAFLPVMPFLRSIDELNDRLSPGCDGNRRISAANLVWMAIGAVFHTLIVYGLVVGDIE